MQGKEQDFDYSKTLYLPNTNFAMRASLPQNEPNLLEYWAEQKIYNLLREQSKNKPRYVLHDGPPYANGNLHIGHALNKILKDTVVRSKQMSGFNCAFIPGWDCHGLPIEWKVEEGYRAKNISKDQISVNDFRQSCREFAAYWVKEQSEQFKRFGILANFDSPYLTMDYKSESLIAAELLKFVQNGLLYRGSKPVMWSVTEQTALAEAEIEYHEHESDVVWVKFPIKNAKDDLVDAFIVIWTTTPWTIPANRAVSYNSSISYGLYEVTAVVNDFGPQIGEKLIFANSLVNNCAEKAKLELSKLRDISSDELASMLLNHPLHTIEGYSFVVPMLNGEHVTEDAGTGFVHTAPSHGRDDFDIWMKNSKRLAAEGIDVSVPFTVNDDGYYSEEVPFFSDKQCRVIDDKGKKGNANVEVIAALISSNNLFARGRVKHSYPHSWRSKKPLISRSTPQWFVAMDKPFKDGKTLREVVLGEVEKIKFTPKASQPRLTSMLSDRPDWVLSRQRSWGVPICIFVNAKGSILKDKDVDRRILEAFEAEGADAWFAPNARERFLAERSSEDWQQVFDILDVWFDSGCSHRYVLEERENLHVPADLYFEGSDQHRGWFQSSLLEACGTIGEAPYKQLVTHGFTLDEKGRKMSKSLGNVVDPQIICNKYGADILRLWVMTSDYSEDQRVGDNIIKMNVDYYRKLRNALRWMLGNLSHYKGEEFAYEDLPSLEKYILHRLSELDVLVKDSYDRFDFKKIIHTLLDFTIVDLSAFYFDIRKDALYCDAPSSVRRKASLYVISKIFDHLILWLAPMLVFTAEEAWQERYKYGSVHLQEFLPIDEKWVNPEISKQWQKVRKLRRVVTGALEVERAEKTIGSSLEAAPEIYVADKDILDAIDGLNIADICITSDAKVIAIDSISSDMLEKLFVLKEVPGVAVNIVKAVGKKCMRSWRCCTTVGEDPAYPDVCARDAKALSELKSLGLLDI